MSQWPSTFSNLRAVQPWHAIASVLIWSGLSVVRGSSISARSRRTSAYTAAPSSTTIAARITFVRVRRRISTPPAAPPDQHAARREHERQPDEEHDAERAELCLRQRE